MAKKEARIILPTVDNAGRSLAAVAVWLEHVLIAEFGGFTRADGVGGWLDGATPRVEQISIYDIAVDWEKPDTGDYRDGGWDADSLTASALRSLAGIVRDRAGQESVYLRLPCGHVHFVGAEDDSAVIADSPDASHDTVDLRGIPAPAHRRMRASERWSTTVRSLDELNPAGM